MKVKKSSYLDHNGKEIRIRKQKKRYILGEGYPWYQDAISSSGKRQTYHGLGSIKLYNTNVFPMYGPSPDIVMLDPKETHNGKKYKLILEEC